MRAIYRMCTRSGTRAQATNNISPLTTVTATAGAVDCNWSMKWLFMGFMMACMCVYLGECTRVHIREMKNNLRTMGRLLEAVCSYAAGLRFFTANIRTRCLRTFARTHEQNVWPININVLQTILIIRGAPAIDLFYWMCAVWHLNCYYCVSI